MRKVISFGLIIAAVVTLVACGSASSETTSSSLKTLLNEPAQDSKKESENIITVNPTSLEELLIKQAVHVTNTNYAVQDDQFKSLYPDMLQAIIINNSEYDIKDAVIAFVAWDANNLPIKIKGQMDFTDGDYIKEVSFQDINFVPGTSFGSEQGYGVDEGLNIHSFKAIVASWKSFDGTEWNNPYFEGWKKMYSGNKFSDELSASVKIAEDSVSIIEGLGGKGAETITEEELMKKIEDQEVKVTSTDYIIQGSSYKALYPDMLSVIIYNGTSKDLKNAEVAFVAWDSNGLPVKIKGQMDFSDGTYVKQVECKDINLVPGGSYGKGKGYSLDEHMNISSFKAIVVSWESFDGETWYNPMYTDWKSLYEGKKL